MAQGLKVINYFYYFPIISPLGRAWPFIWQTEIPFTQGYLMQSLVEIGPVVLEKKMKMWKVYRWTDRQTDDGRQGIRKAHLSFQLRWAKNLLHDYIATYFKVVRGFTACLKTYSENLTDTSIGLKNLYPKIFWNSSAYYVVTKQLYLKGTNVD